MSSGLLPEGLDSVGACVVPRIGLYVLASRGGALWVSSDGISWSPVGQLAIRDVTVGCDLGEGLYAFGSAHGEVESVTLTPFSQKVRQRLHADAVQDLVVLDSRTVGTVSRDRALRVWRVAADTFELLWSIPELHEHFVNCAVRVGGEIWTGSSDGTIASSSLASRSRLSISKTHADSIRTLDLSHDGMKLLSLSDDATYNVYDIRSRTVLKQWGEQRQYSRSGDFLFHDRGASVAFGSTSGFLHHGTIPQGSFSRIRMSACALRALRYLNEDQIICGDEAGTLSVCDKVTEKVSIVAFTGAGLTTIRVNPSDQTILCGYRDGVVRVFLMSSLTSLNAPSSCAPQLSTTPGHEAALNPLAENASPAPRLTRQIHQSIVGDLLPLANGLLFSCSDDHTIKTTTLDSLSILKTTSLEATAINNLHAFADVLVATTDGGTVFVLDRTSHEVYGRYSEHSSPVRALARISSRLVATGDRVGEVRIWDVYTRNTASVNRFMDRVIELGYEERSQRLFVLTESELASLQLDDDWFVVSQGEITVSEEDRRTDRARAKTRKAGIHRSHKSSLHGRPKEPLAVADGIAVPDDVEIARIGGEFHLSLAEDRLLRGFTRWRGGTRCELRLLSGGLSDAHVFGARVFDGTGATRVNAVAKVGSRAAIDAEAKRYDTEVSRLSPGATPRRLESLQPRDGSTAAVFYSLAEGYDRTEFQAALESASIVPSVVDCVRELTAPWREGVPETRTTIAELRRSVLNDSELAALATRYSLAWVGEFERHTVQARQCTIHGDLHGGNILVDRRGTATIIDYGNVGNGSAPFDPITLEFSHLFHPAGPLRASEWPSVAQARMWRTDDYLVECPMPEVVRACWRWAEIVCAGHREIAGAAHCYLLSQLKYPDTEKDLILGLLFGARAFFDRT